jgi:hypothetical protein
MFERQMKSESWGLELMWGGKNHKKNDEKEAATQKKRRCPPEDACDVHPKTFLVNPFTFIQQYGGIYILYILNNNCVVLWLSLRSYMLGPNCEPHPSFLGPLESLQPGCVHFCYFAIFKGMEQN